MSSADDPPARPAKVTMTADGGGASSPRLISDPSGQHGNGLRLVCALATRTEITGDSQGRSFLASIPNVIPATAIHPAIHDGLLPEER